MKKLVLFLFAVAWVVAVVWTSVQANLLPDALNLTAGGEREASQVEFALSLIALALAAATAWILVHASDRSVRGRTDAERHSLL